MDLEYNKNITENLLNNLDNEIFKGFGDYNRLEESYKSKRNDEFPFTEIPAFVKETIGPDLSDTNFISEYMRYARGDVLLQNNLGEFLSGKEYAAFLFEYISIPFVNYSVEGEPLSVHIYNTPISKTIRKLLGLPEENVLRQELEALLYSESTPEMIHFVFNQIALDFPLDYLDLVMRLTMNLELLPGTFNFFLFAALYDLYIDLNLNLDESLESELDNFVSDLKTYAKSEEIRNIINEDNPKLQQLFNRGLGTDTVINTALNLSNHTARCYHFMDIDEDMD